MRFKAKILQEKLSLFTGVISIMEKILGHSACVLHLSENEIRFAVPTLEGANQIQVFSELNQQALFCEYRIDSQADNCIMFQVGVENFLKALNSGKTAPVCQIKLVKRDGVPNLCIETRALEIDVVHDIPVKIMHAKDIENYLPPDVPIPKIQLELPHNRSVRTVIDRLKNINKNLYIDADMGGSMIFRVHTDQSIIKTYYGNLIPRFDSLDEEQNCSNKSTVKIDSKQFASILHFYGISFDNAILCIVEDYALIIHIRLPYDCGSLTYYAPLLTNDEVDSNSCW